MIKRVQFDYLEGTLWFYGVESQLTIILLTSSSEGCSYSFWKYTSLWMSSSCSGEIGFTPFIIGNFSESDNCNNDNNLALYLTSVLFIFHIQSYYTHLRIIFLFFFFNENEDVTMMLFSHISVQVYLWFDFDYIRRTIGSTVGFVFLLLSLLLFPFHSTLHFRHHTLGPHTYTQALL